MPKPGESSLGIGAKEERGVKETRKMFKQIGRVASKIKGIPGTIGAIGAGIESVMPFLESLAPLFQAFEPILTIINAMFMAFAGAITAELVPALMPLFTAMVGMIPIFTELGSIVGQIIVMFLIPLINVFMAIIPPIAAIVLQLVQTEGFTTALIVTLGILGGVLVYLSYPIIVIVGLVTGLIVVFNFISDVINEGVLPAIGAFIMGIAIMIDAITLGMAGAVNFVNELMGTLPGTEVTPTAPLPTLPPGITELQTGARRFDIPKRFVPFRRGRGGDSRERGGFTNELVRRD